MNLKTGVSTCAYQGVRNVCFSDNLACFVFLKHSFWDSPFCLITDNKATCFLYVTCQSNTNRKKNYFRLMEKEKTKKLYGPFSRLVANSIQSSVRKVALKNFTIFTRNHLCWCLFLIKLTVLKSNFIWKVTPTQVFFCEYCKIF